MFDMKRIVVLFAAVWICSCVGREDVSLRGVSDVAMGSSSVDVKIGIENRSAHKLHLKECHLTLSMRSREVMQAVLADPVVVPGHFSGDIPVSLHLKITDPIAGLALLATMESSVERMTVSGDMLVKAGWQSKRIEFKNEPLSKILSNFGAKELQGI